MPSWILWPLAGLGALVVAVWLISLIRGAWPTEAPTTWVCGCEARFESRDELKVHMALECPNRPAGALPTTETVIHRQPDGRLQAFPAGTPGVVPVSKEELDA